MLNPPTCSESLHGHGGVGHAVRIAGRLHILWLPTRPVLVVRMIRHVLGPNPLGLVNKGPLFRLREQLPLGAEPLGDLRVVHLGVLLRWKSQIKIHRLAFRFFIDF